MGTSAELPPPPSSWRPARRLARAFAAPVERFLAIEAASGLILLAAATLALGLANAGWGPTIEAVWCTPVGLQFGDLAFTRDLRWWINDGLMTIFFFVVGLEIRRELHAGELSELRRAALPLAAALGGMLLPAAIYGALNAGRPTAAGWGVPMATDIAFAVGVLAVLGKRVPPALRILLLALAVIDDLGAIVVIAVFYGEGVAWAPLALAGLALAGIVALQLAGVRRALAYLPLGVVAWAAAYASGVHPTIAGVAVGLLTPVRAWWGPLRFADTAEETARAVRAAVDAGETDLQEPLHTLGRAARETVPPVERVLHALHGWVAWFIMPLFAFANAGITLGGVSFVGDGWRVFVGVSAGLVLGKLVGVLVASRFAVGSGMAGLPRGVGWRELGVVGGVAGIGFTMALFVAQLAFPPGTHLETAKLGILVASAISGVGGLLAGRLLLPDAPRPDAAPSEAAAEASTEV